MGKLYTQQLFPTTATSATAQAGFPATNALRPALAQPYRAATANPTVAVEYLQFDLGADKLIRGVLIHDTNAVSMWVDTVTAAAVTTSGTPGQATVANRHGRGRALVTKNVTGKLLNIYPFGGTTDGLPYRIGAVYVFGSVATLPPGPEWGYDPAWLIPRASQSLQNGQRARASVGMPYNMISAHIKAFGTEDWSTFFQALDRGICALDMELAAPRTAHVWPVTLENDEIKNPQTSLASNESDIVLREAV